MLVGQAGAGSDQLKSMHLVLQVFKSSWRPWEECCMALKLVWRVVNSVQRRARCIQNGVVCVESHAARATFLIYTEKKVSPRVEPCGTP
jgi:hypothetical protein